MHEKYKATFKGKAGLKTVKAQPEKLPSQVNEVLRSPGQELDAATRQSMSRRFANVSSRQVSRVASNSPQTALAVSQPGDRYEQEAEKISDEAMRNSHTTNPGLGHDFSRVRIHTDTRAADSARSLAALAYTVGDHVVFARGQYAPQANHGQRLLAHELAHTFQQGNTAGRMIMRTWDKADSDCAGLTESDRWIPKVEVNQEVPQNVVVNWSDGKTDTDECSSGKGHCCVDSSNSSGVACTIAESQVNGSNCTPITQHDGFSVKGRVLDHKGVHFWTEFESDRAIALHQYDDNGVVNGTPLSHGCVRLHKDMAKKIFCNVRQQQTKVQVHGFARPKCDTAALQDVWKGDFQTAGMDLGQDGDINAEIMESRKELNAAFGRTLKVDEIKKLTEKDIPRCKSSAPLPNPPTPPTQTTP